MRRALLLLPRLQPSTPACVRAFASGPPQTSQAVDAQADAAEDHSRGGMVSSCFDQSSFPFDKFCLSLVTRFAPSFYALARTNSFGQVSNTIALMEAHCSSLRFIKTRCVVFANPWRNPSSLPRAAWKRCAPGCPKSWSTPAPTPSQTRAS